MKNIITGLIMFLFALSGWSKDYNTVLVNLKDGSNVTVTMTEKLALQFDDENLTATGGTAEVTIPKNKIVNFTHTYDSNTEGVMSPEMNQDIIFENAGVRFTNLPANSALALYDVAGQLMRQATAEGAFFLSFDGLGSGIYILTVNGISFKINIK